VTARELTDNLNISITITKTMFVNTCRRNKTAY